MPRKSTGYLTKLRVTVTIQGELRIIYSIKHVEGSMSQLSQWLLTKSTKIVAKASGLLNASTLNAAKMMIDMMMGTRALRRSQAKVASQ